MLLTLTQILELSAFAVSAAAFAYGVFQLLRKGMPKYFQLYVCAAGCYMLEELWVIVNSLLGTGSQDGLVTVRLFGFFGCLCFMLSANTDSADKRSDRKAGLLSMTAPAALLAIYALYAHSQLNATPAAAVIIGLVSISPALFASRLSLKHLLLNENDESSPRTSKCIDVLSLIFYAVNYLYPLADLYFAGTVMSIYDISLAAILFGIIILCSKGAAKWKTQI